MGKTTRNRNVVNEMINHISKENNLRKIFEDNTIGEIITVSDINTYVKEGSRRGIIADVQEKNADTRSKIMIDLKQGQPIINQVYDALYDIGQDCSKRIIVYSNGQNEFDKGIPVADYWPVSCLIDNLQDYPLSIYFLEMNEETFTVGPHYMNDHFGPYQKLPINKAPTKEQFMVETFWSVYFESCDEAFYKAHKTYSDRFRDTSDWGHIIFIDCTFYGEIQLYWDQNGVRYVIQQKTDDDEYLKMVLDHEMSALQERYGSDAIVFENVVGKMPRLHIKYSDKPFDWLYTASPNQITEFAKSMHEDAWGLRWRIEDRIDGILE